ncbi:MAG TPA: hypothetical protein QGH10_11975 [Armatimonadota bacterium]|nr:hypothetical protein [Armatimonadota bacterium]
MTPDLLGEFDARWTDGGAFEFIRSSRGTLIGWAGLPGSGGKWHVLNLTQLPDLMSHRSEFHFLNVTAL